MSVYVEFLPDLHQAQRSKDVINNVNFNRLDYLKF